MDLAVSYLGDVSGAARKVEVSLLWYMVAPLAAALPCVAVGGLCFYLPAYLLCKEPGLVREEARIYTITSCIALMVARNTVEDEVSGHIREVRRRHGDDVTSRQAKLSWGIAKMRCQLLIMKALSPQASLTARATSWLAGGQSDFLRHFLMPSGNNRLAFRDAVWHKVWIQSVQHAEATGGSAAAAQESAH